MILAWTILCGLGLAVLIVVAVANRDPILVESAFFGGLFLIGGWLIGLPVIVLLGRWEQRRPPPDPPDFPPPT